MELIDDEALTIYTDGSSLSGPRRGGIGVRFVWIDSGGAETHQDFDLEGYLGASNNEMEIQALIEAMKISLDMGPPTEFDLSTFRKIVVYTDSLFLVDGYRSARSSWPRQKWRTRDGAPVLHATQWKELCRLVDRTRKRFDLKWVKGHKKSQHNKAADRLARGSAKRPATRRIAPERVRRKTTDQTIQRGSVRMRGQEMTIRILRDRYLREQRCWTYKYEVKSEDSADMGKVDMIFSTIRLEAGHTYDVRVNEDDGNPWIEEAPFEVVRVDSDDEGSQSTASS